LTTESGTLTLGTTGIITDFEDAIFKGEVGDIGYSLFYFYDF